MCDLCHTVVCWVEGGCCWVLLLRIAVYKCNENGCFVWELKTLEGCRNAGDHTLIASDIIVHASSIVLHCHHQYGIQYPGTSRQYPRKTAGKACNQAGASAKGSNTAWHTVRLHDVVVVWIVGDVCPHTTACKQAPSCSLDTPQQQPARIPRSILRAV